MASHKAHQSRSTRYEEMEMFQVAGVPTRSQLAPSTAASSTSKIPSYSSTIFSRPRDKTSIAPTQGEGRRDVASTIRPSGGSRKLQKPPMYGRDLRQGLRAPVVRTLSNEPALSSTSSLGLGTHTIPKSSTASNTASEQSVERPRHVLRRKPSSINQHSEYARTESTDSSHDLGQPLSQNIPDFVTGGYRDPYPGSILGITLPSTSTTYIPSARQPLSSRTPSSSGGKDTRTARSLYPLSTQNLPLSTPLVPACPSSPSTRCSESPGPFSRASTPTSMSSHSPALHLVSKAVPRTRQLSPTRSRPPVTLAGRRVAGLVHGDESGKLDSQGLPALRESLTSSSSGSTVKAGERGGSVSANHKTKTPRLSPPPPSPPVRRSSKKFSKTSPASKRIAQNTEAQSGSRVAGAEAGTTLSALPLNQTVAAPRTYAVPPTRPSRAGTTNLEDQYQPSPVIHSNLSHLQTTGHKRRESFELAKPSASGRMVTAGPSQSAQAPRSGIAAKQPSPTRRLSSVEAMASPRAIEYGQSPPAQPAGPSAGLNRGVSPTSAGSGRSSSRFGFFSRRPKATSSDEAEAMVKKGPTAGTGHEGYGKYARRGRSGSASTSSSRGRSTSASSTSGSAARTPSSHKSSITSRGEQEIDDFFLERLAPVVIGGGGTVIENRNRAVDIAVTGIGKAAGRPSLDSRSSNRSKTSLGTRLGGGNSTTSVSSLGSTSQSRSRKPSMAVVGDIDVSDCSDGTRVSALAARRSLHRSQLLQENEPIKLPAPIRTNVLAPSPSLNSYDTSYSSIPQTDSTLPPIHDLGEGSEGLWLKPKLEKAEKSSRRWNFFQWSQRSPQKATPTTVESQSSTVMELPVTITPRLDARPVAHYAILDAPEQFDSDAMEDSSHEAEISPVAEIKILENTPKTYPDEFDVETHFISPLLPSRPVFPPGYLEDRRPSSPKVMLHPKVTFTPERTPVDPPQVSRPSRLPQVGRIPRVISKRDHSHKPPIQSFSRPFAQQPRPSYQPRLATDGSDKLTPSPLPTLGIQTDLIPARQWERFEMNNPASAPVTGTVANDPFVYDATEFIAFPPRKMSEVSGSSSSGVMSFANTTATTAVLPRPDAALSEDEVWNEYDDLLDNVMSTTAAKTPRSTTSSLGAPFQYSDLATKAQQLEVENPAVSLVNKSAAEHFKTSYVTLPPEARAITSELHESSHDSKLVSPLPSSTLPSTPMSFTEFFAGYEERNTGSDKIDTKHNSPSRSRSGSDSAESKGLSLPAPSSGDKLYYRNTQLMNFAEKERDGPEAQTNLRFGALMTSRWLSFGRVLFSPAHTEIKNNRQDRILILDGLGNDDWSFYCALTYPDATVYNLSPYQPSGQISPKRRESGAWQPPSNHRQIHHTSIAHPFPFPKGFFTAVVLRFPAANSEAAYRNAISECKRVLRPGGFLEISMLDLDMMNMGNRARRAVRMLKVRMQVADPTVSLKPVSDNIQKMLGRRGFENLNRCMVGVPVAGKVSDSRSGSFDEASVSLGDMLKDPSEQGDEGITKMVVKVGRWWYTRCYELGVLPDGDLERSIWNDKALLKECEKRETSFKLLICYAQKPLAPRRRTISV